jgi:predicted metallopeptidase
MKPMATSATFDYTAAIAAVCDDICFRVPELRHIDMSRVAVGFSRTKNSEPYGIFASATPLRFENGEPFRQSRGRIWTIQRHFRPDGVECLYILYFYVPRFVELPLSQKLDTIVHELYHVNPLFNGDLRRFSGRRFAHGSKRQYDQTVSRLVQDWLKHDPPSDLWDFLCYNYRDLVAKYGKLNGTQIPAPRIVPLTSNHAACRNAGTR